MFPARAECFRPANLCESSQDLSGNSTLRWHWHAVEVPRSLNLRDNSSAMIRSGQFNQCCGPLFEIETLRGRPLSAISVATSRSAQLVQVLEKQLLDI